MPQTSEQQPLRRADLVGGVWHGAFLAVGMALVDPNAVIPALVVDLMGSPIWVGGLAALLAVAAAVPQPFVARFVEPLQRKRRVLLTAIYLRTASWAGLGLLITAAGPDRPKLVLSGLVVLLGLFSVGGALAHTRSWAIDRISVLLTTLTTPNQFGFCQVEPHPIGRRNAKHVSRCGTRRTGFSVGTGCRGFGQTGSPAS